MDKKTALNKAMHICSKREYCAFDVREKLKQWDVETRFFDEIVETLFEHNFIDHTRYAEAFVNDKIKFNHWGKVKVRYYLNHKNIENAIIDVCLKAYNQETYLQIASEEIKKKWRKTKANSLFELKNKVAKSIINKGFESGMVFALLDELNLSED